MPEKSLLPFAILLVGLVWSGLFAWLQSRAAKDAQQPSHASLFLLIGMGGLLLCMAAAGLAAYLKWVK